MSTISFAFRKYWASPTGPQTIHFWAPTLKWGLVIAGISDITRPVENVSGAQNLSLIATAAIWTRWSFVIKPKNYLLASVNGVIALTSSYHLLRIFNYRIRNGDTVPQTIKYIINGRVETVEDSV
ncbi:mitochondrial pyruvate carrier 2 [Monosporozyma servazzii]